MNQKSIQQYKKIFLIDVGDKKDKKDKNHILAIKP